MSQQDLAAMCRRASRQRYARATGASLEDLAMSPVTTAIAARESGLRSLTSSIRPAGSPKRGRDRRDNGSLLPQSA